MEIPESDEAQPLSFTYIDESPKFVGVKDRSLNRSVKAPRKPKKERAPKGKWHLIGNSQTSVTLGDKRKKALARVKKHRWYD